MNGQAVLLLLFYTFWTVKAAEECIIRKVNFDRPMKGERLLNHVNDSKRVESMTTCRAFCIWDDNCVSINYNDTEDSDKQHFCELNHSDGKQYPEDLKKEKDFTHQGTENPCSNSPCGVNGLCQTGFGSLGYRCVCKAGYSDQACEKEYYFNWSDSVILSGHPDYEKKLNEYLEPVQVSGKQWKLCYRASEHNYGAAAFHTSCDRKGATVTLVRVGDNVFGGYGDKSWDAPSGELARWTYSNKSLLFSLKNNLNEQFKMFINRNKQSWGQAMYSWNSWGPRFGYDLCIANRCDVNTTSFSNLGVTYKPPKGYTASSHQAIKLLAGSYTFKCDEYEVFYQE